MTTTANREAPDLIADTVNLIAMAEASWSDRPDLLKSLSGLHERLEGPLKIGLAGMVKAGKSTLLNALLGERIAPTDAGECTRVVTWYRHSDHPSVVACLKSGETRSLPIRREHGRLVLDLGDTPAHSVEKIEIGWPASVLRYLTLIDTPGIESLSEHVSERAVQFLTPAAAPSPADAIIYLMRHLHGSDLSFLEAFADTAAGTSKTVNAVAVLSRADEVGSGRIDSMLSASKVASRYAKEGALTRLAIDVVPVAGLLGEAARTLREEEFRDLKRLAGLERKERELTLISADRFGRAKDVAGITRTQRRNLLARLGIFGIRVGVTLIRAGAANSSELAEQLVGQSGLGELVDVIQRHFSARAEELKVRGVLDSLEGLIRAVPPQAASVAIETGIERIRASAHGLRELELLSQLRLGGAVLPDPWASRAERIIGGGGTDSETRLGVAPGAMSESLYASALGQVDEWRVLAHSPTMPRTGVDACRVVIRSLEEVALRLRLS